MYRQGLDKVTQPHDAIVVVSGAGLGLVLEPGWSFNFRNAVLDVQEGRHPSLKSFAHSIHTVSKKSPPVMVISHGGKVYICEEGKQIDLPNEVRDFLRKFT